MTKLGTVIFQANDNTDIFYKAEVFENGSVGVDDAIGMIDYADWDNTPWITGNDLPKPQPVTVEADTSVIYALFKAYAFPASFKLIIYIFYEETEEFLGVEEEEKDKEPEMDYEQRELE